MHRPRLAWLVAFLVLVLCVAAPARSQSFYGSLLTVVEGLTRPIRTWGATG